VERRHRLAVAYAVNIHYQDYSDTPLGSWVATGASEYPSCHLWVRIAQALADAEAEGFQKGVDYVAALATPGELK